MDKEEILLVLRENIGENLSLWCPGSSNLGWAFHVENAALTVNSFLGNDYKRRMSKHLRPILPGVAISFSPAPETEIVAKE